MPTLAGSVDFVSYDYYPEFKVATSRLPARFSEPVEYQEYYPGCGEYREVHGIGTAVWPQRSDRGTEFVERQSF